MIFHGKSNLKIDKITIKGKLQWIKKEPHKKPRVSSPSMKRIENIARGAHSISREQANQTYGNKSLRKATIERGTYVSKKR